MISFQCLQSGPDLNGVHAAIQIIVAGAAQPRRSISVDYVVGGAIGGSSSIGCTRRVIDAASPFIDEWEPENWWVMDKTGYVMQDSSN